MSEKKLGGRRKSRTLALTALYMNEVTKDPIDQILQNMEIQEKPQSDIFEYTKRIVYKAVEKSDEINKLIKAQCENWDLNRLTIIDISVIRIGVTEILYFDDVPFKVSIDEAIEIGKLYSTEKSGKFINGILDPIAIQHQNKFKSIEQ